MTNGNSVIQRPSIPLESLKEIQESGRLRSCNRVGIDIDLENILRTIKVTLPRIGSRGLFGL